MPEAYMSLNVDEIKEILPHRDPFLLVDRVDGLEMGKRAIGIKNVTAAAMPSVLIIEAMAQLVGCIMPRDPKESNKLAFFAGINDAQFVKQVQPGDTLTMIVEILSMRRGICKAKGTAMVDEELVCTAEEMMFVFGK
jgi:3-hydroxyacyl-[acyl-carrier-protein] dehydratase